MWLVTGAEVRRIRKQLALTQRELAKQLGVAENTVARWERDEMGMRSTAEKLLRLLAQAGPRGRRR